MTKREKFNSIATHPLQAFEWGIFREKTGIRVVREKDFQMTIHKIPYFSFKIGYIPKSKLPTKEMVKDLREIGKKENCIFIQIEPNVIENKNLKPASPADGLKIENLGLRPSAHPLFTKYTFELDLAKNEEELLKKMHPKTRYNIKVAQKNNVKVVEDNSNKAFEEYLKLTKETTKRQKFYAHSEKYHRLMWETLKPKNREQRTKTNILTARLLTAKYKGEIFVAWMLFVFKDTLYYPYGASSNQHKELMASNLMMWEAIKFGKKLNLKKFDMWGSLGPNPNPVDPWYGFHRFKLGYGADLVEFLGSFDLVLNRPLYTFYLIADKIRWFILRFK